MKRAVKAQVHVVFQVRTLSDSMPDTFSTQGYDVIDDEATQEAIVKEMTASPYAISKDCAWRAVEWMMDNVEKVVYDGEDS